LRAPFISGVDSRNSYIGLAMAILALAFTYWMSARGGSLDESFAHASYGLLFVFMGTMFAVVFSATRITSEKESQTWPLLLATPLSDRDILLGKAVSAFRRCLPIWGLLAVHMVLFILVGYIHPVAAVHLLVLVVWLTCFVTSVGLYFGTRFARTTSSVVASFAVILGLWVLGPTIAGLLSVFGESADPLRNYMWFHPAFQAELVMSGASGVRNADLPLRSLRYGEERVVFDLFDLIGNPLRFAGMTKILLATASVYLAAAAIFFWRARCRLRRSVFR
jgi:ABC-type transport system involved in multi-copper enzyme maturation permease subunit